MKFIHVLIESTPIMSLPLWECGLKLTSFCKMFWGYAVTPLVGVWIEIAIDNSLICFPDVTPLVGVWIEINIEDAIDARKNGHSPCGSVD